MADRDQTESDAELVAAVNGGDWGAFDRLYYRHRDWAYRLAWRFTGDATDAQDVVQEVFLYLAGKFPGLELRAAMTTLLYPAVKHTAIALRKKRRRERTSLGEQEDLLPAELAADVETLRKELAITLGHELSLDHREVVLMRFVDDMTLEEIAAALGIPLGTAKSRLHHALANLRENPALRKHFEQ